MFFFINWVVSAIVWVVIAYLFHFSFLGWFIGLIVSFIYKEFIGPKLIIAIGDNTFNKHNDIQ